MIIISPYARAMREPKPHPKNYPWWKEVVDLLGRDDVVQVGIEGEDQIVPDFRKNLPLPTLAQMVKDCDAWVSVDSFFQHFAWDLGKPGIVIWGQSDPNIFGHPENINLLKDRTYLREKQFWLWEQCDFNADSFVEPKVVVETISNLLHK